MSKGIPFVGIGDFDFDGKLQIEKARVVSRSFLSEHAGRYSLGDDLLAIGRVASIGKVVRLPKATDPYLISPTLAVLRPHSVDISYLFFALQAPNFQTQLEALSRGSTRRSVGIIDLRKASIPLPSPAEQQRIVDILGRAFGGTATAKANAEKNLQNSRALFESHLQSVFTQAGKGWVERRLWEVFEIGSSKRIRETEWTSAGVPFYGGKEIVRLAKFGSAVSAAYISEEKYRDYASKYDMPRKGDILITARGTIGVGYVVKEGDKFYYKDGNIISFREKTPTNALFVLYAFRSKTLVDQFADLTGATVKHLPIERAKDLVLKMPTFATQNSVVEHLENIEKEAQRLESIYQRKLAVLEALKKSLLHQAFAGKL
jgi:type I restriction enzyme S subunit